MQQNVLTTRHSLAEPRLDPHNFTIHYGEQSSKGKWKHKVIIFSHSDPIQIFSWVKTLQNHLQSRYFFFYAYLLLYLMLFFVDFTHRPKTMLVFVNPFGGKRNAMKIYEKYAGPLFTIAGIDVTVNVSQRKDQIKDFVSHHNLDIFDSIVCVGGDGTLSELFNGLVLRECRLKGVDLNNSNESLPKPSLPVGVIPGLLSKFY